MQSPACLNPFDAAPPAGNKVLIFSAEFDQNGWDLTGVFYGQTYPYRDAFEGHGILGARVDSTDEYVRVLPKIKVGDKTGRLFFLDVVLKLILRDVVLQVRLTTGPPDESPAAEFLQLLLDQPQVWLKQDA